MSEYGLGRVVSKDRRDQRFLLSAPTVPATRTHRYWYDNGWWGDQGATSSCVGHAWAHFVEDSPRTHPAPGFHIDPYTIYREAQKVDEWTGEGYDGTSVRAGAKYLQAQGVIGEYLWAFDVDTVIRNILEVGPLVVGTNWYEGMFYPKRDFIIHPTGRVAGGHAYVLNGYNKATKLFRCKNSWGRGWGSKGHAYMHRSTFARLLAEDGEACIATETP